MSLRGKMLSIANLLSSPNCFNASFLKRDIWHGISVKFIAFSPISLENFTWLLHHFLRLISIPLDLCLHAGWDFSKQIVFEGRAFTQWARTGNKLLSGAPSSRKTSPDSGAMKLNRADGTIISVVRTKNPNLEPKWS